MEVDEAITEVSMTAEGIHIAVHQGGGVDSPSVCNRVEAACQPLTRTLLTTWMTA